MASNPQELELGAVLGTALRLARQRAGLTMQRLAELSGVSQPHLSQMENGKVSPSINTLYRLANAMGISAQQLLPEARGTSLEVVRAGSVPATPIVDRPDAATAQVLVGAPDRMLQVQEVQVQPGQDLGEWFRHEGEEYLYVIEGNVRIEVHGNAAEDLTSHDSAWYDSKLEHRWTLLGEQPARLLVVSAVASRVGGHGVPSERAVTDRALPDQQA
jgi:transcriptional regulator with XRE-family HTH domain